MAKSVLITGGAKRLGQEMALSLAEKGWAIALHYRNSLEEAESTREKIEEAGSDCKLFSANLENPKESVEMMKQILSEFTDLDLLEMGDDAFLDLVAQREAAIGEGVRAARDLQAGRIWPEMVHLDGRGLAALEDQVCDSLTAPAGRSSAERRLARELGVPAAHVALRLAPRRMQAKAPDTPIGWRNGQAIPFDRLCREHGLPLSAASLPMRYAGLRDLSLYVRDGAAVASITAGRLVEILRGVAFA